MPRRLGAVTMLWAALGVGAAPAEQGSRSVQVPAQQVTAEQVTERVAEFHATLIAVLKVESIEGDRASTNSVFDTRLAMLRPAVDRLFDLENAARLSVGRGWRKFSPDQREMLQAALGELIAKTYASRFGRYRGQRFDHLTTQPTGGSWVVRTALVRPNAEKVMLDYYVRNAGAFNVLANGVSDAALRRAEYAAILKKSGFDALLEHVRAAADSLVP